MLNYSVFSMMNPMKPAEEPRYYGRLQINETLSLEKFASHIVDHGGVFSRGTVKGVIADMCDCIVEQLLNGNKVKLGELGEFSLSMSAEGAPSAADFTAQNIRSLNIVFTPGEQFANLRAQAVFNPVPSRLLQAAALKAEKMGESTIDVNAVKKRPSTEESV